MLRDLQQHHLVYQHTRHLVQQDGFDEMVATEWADELAAGPIGKMSIATWQNKIRHLRRFLQGWAKHLSGKYKKEKERLLNLIDLLDIQAETCPLTERERVDLKQANDQYNKIRCDKEIKWAQRAKGLKQEEGTIIGDENLKVYITKYYKKIFGPPEDNSVEMMENRIDDIPQLSEEENVLLS
jgi:hypothetical protein